MNGTVSNLIAEKKFGFIAGENGQEYFFHQSSMDTDWYELVGKWTQRGGGAIQVTFEPTKTEKGPRASQVAVI